MQKDVYVDAILYLGEVCGLHGIDVLYLSYGGNDLGSNVKLKENKYFTQRAIKL